MTENSCSDVATTALNNLPSGDAVAGAIAKPVVIDGVEGLQHWLARELPPGPWMTLPQSHIDAFAEATGDRQWIHVDAARAANSVFGSTIAHGFLTLALIPGMLEQCVELRRVAMGVNYGVNKVRFITPVPAGARVRGCFRLDQLTPIEGGVQTHWTVRIELQGSARPALVAEWLTRRYAERT
jgi:acyl dehydratase